MKNVMEYYRIKVILVGHLHKNNKVDKKVGKKKAHLGGYQNKREIPVSSFTVFYLF